MKKLVFIWKGIKVSHFYVYAGVIFKIIHLIVLSDITKISNLKLKTNANFNSNIIISH